MAKFYRKSFGNGHNGDHFAAANVHTNTKAIDLVSDSAAGIAEDQVTLCVSNIDKLSNIGKEIYKRAAFRAAVGGGIRLKKYCIIYGNSGPLFAPNEALVMSTNNNISIAGVLDDEITTRRTSTIIMMTPNWCYTQSGNIYILGEKIQESAFEYYYGNELLA